MAAEATKTGLDRRELFRRLIGRRVELTTSCKTFDKTGGAVKEVFDDFLMFITTREAAGVAEHTRHWVLFDAITVITESPKVATEEFDIVR
jgi:hypothetical protein